MVAYPDSHQHRIRAPRLPRRVAGQVYSRDDILNRLRGHPALDVHIRAVDILVSRLRRKLQPVGTIRTLRNASYLFAGVRA